jgi:hypothetical protein
MNALVSKESFGGTSSDCNDFSMLIHCLPLTAELEAYTNALFYVFHQIHGKLDGNRLEHLTYVTFVSF